MSTNVLPRFYESQTSDRRTEEETTG